jgi:hypothetical protein
MRTDGLRQIIGKTIHSILVNERRTAPHVQLFLSFTDGTTFELYGDFAGTGRLFPGGEEAALEYISTAQFRDILSRVPERRSGPRHKRERARFSKSPKITDESDSS